MKIFSKIKILIILAGLLFSSGPVFAGEISESKLNDLSLGMKPEQIISILGQPEYRRDDGFNAEGKKVEILQYNILKHIDLAKEPNPMGNQLINYTCSLMIVDGVLVRINRER